MSKDSVPLREYVDALRAADHQAVTIAKAEIDHRLEGMNELREQISSERGTFITVADYERRHDALIASIAAIDKAGSERLHRLETWQANLTGRFIVVGGLAALAFTIVGAFIAHLLGL